MILTAFPVGFFAGLFGIGGGLITVPFLFFIFETLNIDQSYIMHLAVGTSFSIIIPTALASVLTHKKNNYVDINIIKTYIIFVIIGVLAGTIFAALMQTKVLVLFFSLVVYFLGTYLLVSSNKIINAKKKFNLFSRVITGFGSGFVSASMGIGGAVILRIILTLLTAYILQITGLRLIGGLALLYICYKLYIDVIKKNSSEKKKGKLRYYCSFQRTDFI